MKKREKFFAIFTITIIMLTMLYIIKGNIEINNINANIERLNQELGAGDTIKEKYSDEIEEGIQQYIQELESNDVRWTALNLCIRNIMQVNSFEIYKFMGPMTGTVSLVFYSLAITLFIYFMITIDYKNTKQYVLANMRVFGILLVLCFIEEIFGYMFFEGAIILYNNGAYYLGELLPILYLIFLTGNAIKNKKTVQLFNAVFIDLVVVSNIIYSVITCKLDISWGYILGIYIILLVIESIPLLTKKHINEEKEKNEKQN